MTLKRLALCGLLLVVALSSSGCFLRALLGGEVVESLTEEIDRVITAIVLNTTTSVCRVSPFTNLVECTYVFQDPEGFVAPSTSTSQLVSEFGLFGVIIDPVILEMPATVTNIAGTFDDGAGHSGALVVYAGLASVPVDDTRSINASAGKQLVVLDLPAGVPVNNVTFQIGLTFDQRVPVGTGPTQVKAILAGKAEIAGKTFYPPMLPCTTDFATVPPITIPRSATMRNLSVPGSIPACVNARYNYFRAPEVCDLNNDHVVDRNDMDVIRAMVGKPVHAGDPRDVNDDSKVDTADVQACAAKCTGPGCTDPGTASGPIGVSSGKAHNFDQTDRGFARIIGKFTSSAPLDLGASGITATLLNALLESGGDDLVKKLPTTIPSRTRSARVTLFEKQVGATLYRLVVRTCIPTRETCPSPRGLDVGEYEFLIEVVNGMVRSPTECGSTAPKATEMTTRFTLDDGIHQAVDVTIPDWPWSCTFQKNRVTAVRTPIP